MVSGLCNKVCDETVRNLLKKKGYEFLHTRKEGLLKPKDLKERLNFSRSIKEISKKNIWTEREYHSIWMEYAINLSITLLMKPNQSKA